jgi:glucosyl-3-phosphoglycerate synthase
MADFHQEGIITTLHALHEAFDREAYLTGLESKLEEHARHQRICLLLPSLFSEIQTPEVLDPILYGIEKVKYLKRVVIALGGAP